MIVSPNFVRQDRGLNFKVFNYLKQETAAAAEQREALHDVEKSQQLTAGHMV
jgi:hypothetical protein